MMVSGKVWSRATAVGYSAEELFNAIVESLNSDYDCFMSELRRKGQESFYKDQSLFVKRMMLFESVGDTKAIRKLVYNWLLLNPAAEKEFSDYARTWWPTNFVTIMQNFRNDLITRNPMLSDGSLSDTMREKIIKVVMDGNEEYQKMDKALKAKIKDVIAQFVTFKIKETPASSMPRIWEELFK